jgi:hypothetical protein
MFHFLTRAARRLPFFIAKMIFGWPNLLTGEMVFVSLSAVKRPRWMLNNKRLSLPDRRQSRETADP